MMTYRLVLASALLVAGVAAIASAIFVIAGDELAMAIITFAAAAIVAAIGVYLVGAGISILAHETGITDKLKRWVE